MHSPARERETVRLTSARRWTVYGVGIGLWLTGVMWLVFHNTLQRQTPFGTQPHPLEFWWRAAHGLFGFATLWTLGLLWGVHIVRGWRMRRHRISGSILFAVVAVLSGTGYLLYYIGNDAVLAAVTIAHWSIGLALPVAFAAHRWLFRRSSPRTGGTSPRG